MSTPRSSREAGNCRRRTSATRSTAAALAIAVAACLPIAAHALSTDRQQKMKINADYAKIVQNKDNRAPGVTYLTGDVTMEQGSTKASGDEATIYQQPDNAKDAQGKSLAGDVQRVVLVGKKKQAHLEQRQDSGGLFSADSDRIDYDTDTRVAVLTGHVLVNQPGRGEFRGASMTYNTNSGEMESGDKASPRSRVQMVIEPKNKTPSSDDSQPKSDDKH